MRNLRHKVGAWRIFLALRLFPKDMRGAMTLAVYDWFDDEFDKALKLAEPDPEPPASVIWVREQELHERL